MPEGIVDLKDDLEDAYGGEVTRDLLKKRKEAGDLII